MWGAVWEATKESLITLAIIFVLYMLIELAENSVSTKLQKAKKFSPIFSSALGLVPLCGFSVVATDLYSKRHISMGALLAIYIATSDEALPILLSSPDKALMVLPMLLIKFILAFAVGYLVDIIYTKSKKQVETHGEDCHHKPEVHEGCCHHHIEGEKKGWKDYLLHPLLHSLKIFAYILVINLVFKLTIHFVGEDAFVNFLQSAKYFSPLFATLIGLIPNCASSVVLSQVYISGGIGFGACLGGLICNAGLGLVMLFKQNKNQKENFTILGLLVAISLVVGYVVSLILAFR